MILYVADNMVLLVSEFLRIIREMAIEGNTKAEFISSIKKYEALIREPNMCTKGGAEKMLKYLQ